MSDTSYINYLIAIKLEEFEEKLNEKYFEKLTASCKENEELKKRVEKLEKVQERVEKLEKVILELQSKELER